jgi:hemerythrin
MDFQLVNWTEAMSVDGGPIDETHRKLTSLINRLHLVVNCGADCDSVSNILCELADYAGSGFIIEEKFMNIRRYTQRNQHIVEHWLFIDRLTIIIADYERGVEVGNELLMYLIRWVASHVKSHDQSFGAFLKLSDKLQLERNVELVAVAA